MTRSPLSRGGSERSRKYGGGIKGLLRKKSGNLNQRCRGFPYDPYSLMSGMLHGGEKNSQRKKGYRLQATGYRTHGPFVVVRPEA
jgi:hypothetical protein